MIWTEYHLWFTNRIKLEVCFLYVCIDSRLRITIKLVRASAKFFISRLNDTSSIIFSCKNILHEMSMSEIMTQSVYGKRSRTEIDIELNIELTIEFPIELEFHDSTTIFSYENSWMFVFHWRVLKMIQDRIIHKNSNSMFNSMFNSMSNSICRFPLGNWTTDSFPILMTESTHFTVTSQPHTSYNNY